jgi:hypothetical protein
MGIFGKKGQSALEFLMTYGWAILVVLAAIGALAYFGVLSPDKFASPKCVSQVGLTCSGNAVLGANTVTFTLDNNMGNDISFAIADANAITLTPGGTNTMTCTSQAVCPRGTAANGATCASTGNAASLNVVDGNGVTVVLTGCTYNAAAMASGKMYKFDVKMRYTNSASSLLENKVVTINARY